MTHDASGSAGSDDIAETGINRRSLLQRGLAAGLVLSVPSILAACGGGGGSASVLQPQRGGNLRVAMAGGGSADLIDAHYFLGNFIDTARLKNLYDPLVDVNPSGEPQLVLAESFEPNADGTVWTVRIRNDVTFHDGRKMTADDVVSSIRRGASANAVSAPLWGPIKAGGVRKIDKRTVEIPFERPYSILLDSLSALPISNIVPENYNPKRPVGSGPFSFKSFSAGKESTFVRFDDYWNGEVYPDSLEIINIPDSDARVNALLAGQVQLAEGIPGGQTGAVEQAGSLLVGKGGQGLMFVMRTDTGPFRDPRARQAMRSIADREQLVQSVLSGQGTIGNDLLAPLDRCGTGGIPQNEPDIERARSLLASAGETDLSVTLTTAPIATGVVEMCQVFAQQAQAAGVSIDVQRLDTGGFFNNYLGWPFTVEYLASGSSSLFTTATLLLTPDAPYNATHWSNAQFNALYDEGLRTTDIDRRCELTHEMQAIFHEDSGYVVWGFANFVDGQADNVGGVTATSTYPLGGFRFREAFLA